MIAHTHVIPDYGAAFDEAVRVTFAMPQANTLRNPRYPTRQLYSEYYFIPAPIDLIAEFRQECIARELGGGQSRFQKGKNTWDESPAKSR